MREELWLWFRNSKFWRTLYRFPVFGAVLRGISFFIVPGEKSFLKRVRGGLGKGLWLELFPRWEISIWEGLYELPFQCVLGAFLKPGRVFYDIGGGIGFHSLLAARLGAEVFVFEPDQKAAELIRHHAELNRLADRIIVVEKAVFSSTGVINLVPGVWAEGHGNARVGKTGTEPNVIRVESVAIDDFAREHPAPDVVKIDVEGAESEVLKGASEVFTSVRPFLICEIHDEENEEFVTEWLRAKRYKWFWLGDEQTHSPKHLFAVALET